MIRVGIVDLGTSNLGSLHASLSRMGAKPIHLTEKPQNLGLTHLIVPGVGSFAEAIRRLRHSELDEYIISASRKQIPILGICLGMQLFSGRGDEGGATEGLALIPGTTAKLDSASRSTRVPHVGWNSVDLQRDHFLFSGIPDNTDFYFVHSYCVRGAPEENTVGLTSHGAPFQSVVVNENVLGVQFHPEKSQKNGAQLLHNFLEWSP